MPEDKKVKSDDVKDAMAQSEHSMSLPKRDKSKKVWVILFVITLLALIGLGVYGYIKVQNDNKKIKDQQAQISEMQSSSKILEDKIKALEVASGEASNTDATTKKSVDEEKIAAALKAECASNANENSEVSNNGVIDFEDIKSYKIDIISGNFAEAAYVCGQGQGGGPSVILAKVSDNWNVIGFGLGPIINNDVRKLYGVPSNLPRSGIRP